MTQDVPAEVPLSDQLGSEDAEYTRLKALLDDAWDHFCDVAPGGTLADLLVVKAKRAKFLDAVRQVVEQRDRMCAALLLVQAAANRHEIGVIDAADTCGGGCYTLWDKVDAALKPN